MRNRKKLVPVIAGSMAAILLLSMAVAFIVSVLVIRFLMDEVGFERIEACFDPRNPHSGAVMRKCGMTYEGTFRQADRNNQGICDVRWYAILKE